jgi:hypothetical protein
MLLIMVFQERTMLLPKFLKLVVLGLDSRTVSCGDAAVGAAGGGGSSLP